MNYCYNVLWLPYSLSWELMLLFDDQSQLPLLSILHNFHYSTDKFQHLSVQYLPFCILLRKIFFVLFKSKKQRENWTWDHFDKVDNRSVHPNLHKWMIHRTVEVLIITSHNNELS
jgi:hypothetical protein